MSTNENKQLIEIKQVVQLAEPDFNKLAVIHNAVNFQREMSFAMQILKDKPYLARVAMADKDSLKTAILNVAAVGLSLSPVHKLAYLVPRKDKVCLEISYQGLIALGIECGAILLAVAELVRELDKFVLQGSFKEPIHERDPSKDRGEIKGVYCVAKTPGGDYLTTFMTIDEVYKIRGRSEAWKAYERDAKKLCPWVTDAEDMILKTGIRKASKTWPKTSYRQRLDKVIDITAEPETVDGEPEKLVGEPFEHDLERIQELLTEYGRTTEQFIVLATRVFKRDIKSLSDLTEFERGRSIVLLEGYIENQKKKVAK